MSQWVGTEPRIPADLMALVRREAKKKEYDRAYDQRTVGKILRSVNVPPRLQEKYRSQKFRKLPLTTLKRFNEKWRTIQSVLTGKVMKKPSYQLITRMRQGFLHLQPVFETIRHTKECDGSFKCHKQFGCRHNFIHYNYVIVKLIEEHGTPAEVKYWKPCFKQISEQKRRKLDGLWQEMLRELTRQRAFYRRRKKVEMIPLPYHPPSRPKKRGPLTWS